jgi:hypothetical protein
VKECIKKRKKGAIKCAFFVEKIFLMYYNYIDNYNGGVYGQNRFTQNAKRKAFAKRKRNKKIDFSPYG